MSIEGGGSSALSVVLSGLAIGGLLLGAGVLPSLGGHAPGADAMDADRLPNVESDGDAGAQQPGAGSGPVSSSGGGGGGSLSGGGGSMSDSLFSLGKLLGPLGGIEPSGSGQGSGDASESGGSSGGDSGGDATDAGGGDASAGGASPGGDGQSGDASSGIDIGALGGGSLFGGGSDAGGGSDTSGEENAGDEESADGGLPSFLPYLLGGLAAAGVLAYLYLTDRDVVTALRLLPRRIVGAAVGALLALSGLLERAIGELRRVESLAALPGRALAALVEWIASLRRRAEAATRGAFGGQPTAAAGAAATDVDGGHSSARERIYDAWESVLDAAPVRSYRTAAPGEVARDAAAAGLPAEPVRTIADAFRDVEYGQRDPETRVDRAESARADLTEALESGDEREEAGDAANGDPDGSGGDAA